MQPRSRERLACYIRRVWPTWLSIDRGLSLNRVQRGVNRLKVQPVTWESPCRNQSELDNVCCLIGQPIRACQLLVDDVIGTVERWDEKEDLWRKGLGEDLPDYSSGESREYREVPGMLHIPVFVGSHWTFRYETLEEETRIDEDIVRSVERWIT